MITKSDVVVEIERMIRAEIPAGDIDVSIVTQYGEEYKELVYSVLEQQWAEKNS